MSIQLLMILGKNLVSFTIKQIAQQAKVSHGAVSAVLNDRQNTIRVSQ